MFDELMTPITYLVGIVVLFIAVVGRNIINFIL